VASVYRVGKTFTVAWVDARGKRQYARGLPSKILANQIAESKEFTKHAARHGIIDPKVEKYAREADKPLETHLKDYERWLKAQGRTGQYVRETVSSVRRIFRGAGIERIDHVDRHRIETAVGGMQPLRSPSGADSLSHRSRNKVLSACKSFVAWLFIRERLPTNALARMRGLDPELDRRRVRNPLTADQFTALFNAAASGKRRGGMTGEDRAMRYLLGTATGFRQRTLFSLTPESFHLADGYVEALAGNVKNRKAVAVPLDPELAAVLRPWLAGKAAKRPVFTKLKWADPMTAYRADLKAAGLMYHEAGTNLYADQHSQRNAFITEVIRRGGLKVAQDLAGHSTPTLTSRYGRLGMSDYAGAVKGLVKLPKPAAREGKRKSG
jgi:site-specific recombinase XerD